MIGETVAQWKARRAKEWADRQQWVDECKKLKELTASLKQELQENYPQDDYNVSKIKGLRWLASAILDSEKYGGDSKNEHIIKFIANTKKLEELEVLRDKTQKTLFQNFAISKALMARESRINPNKRLARIRAVKGLTYSIYKKNNCTGNSDNDIIYVWKNQHDEYKIGITSKKLGTRRIETVAHRGKMEFTIIHYVEVNDALGIERVLLQFGKPIARKAVFDGHTEFRVLTKSQLNEIGKILESAVKN